ncbi:MAG: hypothetical protein KatS3mg111_3844 [Pirellulaceae bacterium]|nr:MAG: hypothetical protein KatS3mg111_3844 [Pirellulaceae bacterium]
MDARNRDGIDHALAPVELQQRGSVDFDRSGANNSLHAHGEPQTGKVVPAELSAPPRSPLKLMCGVMRWGGLLILTTLAVLGWIYFRQIHAYTSDVPRPLPIAELPPRTLEQVEEQVEQVLVHAETPSEAPEPIVLNADLINGLIADQPRLRGRLFVEIADGVIHIDISLPASMIPGAGGRYINGSVSARGSWKADSWELEIVKATANDREIPAALVEEMLQQQAQMWLEKRDDVRRWLDLVEEISVREREIWIRPRPGRLLETDVDPARRWTRSPASKTTI